MRTDTKTQPSDTRPGAGRCSRTYAEFKADNLTDWARP
jgi:hypothetical protein